MSEELMVCRHRNYEVNWDSQEDEEEKSSHNIDPSYVPLYVSSILSIPPFNIVSSKT